MYISASSSAVLTLELYNKDTGELKKSISFPVSTPKDLTYTSTVSASFRVKIVSNAAVDVTVTAKGVTQDVPVLPQSMGERESR